MRTSRFILSLCSGLLLLPQLVLAQSGNISVPTPHYTSGPVHIITPEPIASPRPTPSPKFNLPTPSPLSLPGGTPSPQKFCTMFTSVNSTIGDTTTNRYNQLKSDFSGQSGQIKASMAKLEQSLTGARNAADSKRKQDFDALTAKAATPAEQQAIAAFETTVNQAITTERAAVDAADQAFEQGLLSDLSTDQTDLSTAAANYKAAVSAALSAAQASCAAGTDPATVRQTLQTALQTARTNFENALKTAVTSSPDISTLKATRQAAVNAANTAFKATVQQALATLKAALGTSSSPTPTPTP